MTPLRLLSLCSGIGGIDYAWSHLLGQEIVGQVEIDPYCRAVLATQWPDVPHATDIKELTHDDPFAEADLVAGGVPCQPFSNAGKRRGTQDDRHLWPYAFALIERRRPRWVLIENVTGFVRLALDLVQADLESAGYTCQAYILPACALGAPHERQRVFVVAHTPRGRCQIQQDTAGISTQPDPSSPLADADGDQCSLQRRGVWPNPESKRHDVADTDSHRQRLRSDQQERESSREGAPDARHDGTQGLVAHSNPSRLQIGNGCKAEGWAPAAADRRGAGQPQPGMDRDLDGISHWMDGPAWPVPPGTPQAAWEPQRTVSGRISHRADRLKALGNAVVPQQVYPLLRCIIELERGVQW